jgi:hypothetical protein
MWIGESPSFFGRTRNKGVANRIAGGRFPDDLWQTAYRGRLLSETGHVRIDSRDAGIDKASHALVRPASEKRSALPVVELHEINSARMGRKYPQAFDLR